MRNPTVLIIEENQQCQAIDSVQNIPEKDIFEVYFSLLPAGAETAVLSNRKCLKSKMTFLIGNLLK